MFISLTMSCLEFLKWVLKLIMGVLEIKFHDGIKKKVIS